MLGFGCSAVHGLGGGWGGRAGGAVGGGVGGARVRCAKSVRSGLLALFASTQGGICGLYGNIRNMRECTEYTEHAGICGNIRDMRNIREYTCRLMLFSIFVLCIHIQSHIGGIEYHVQYM